MFAMARAASVGVRAARRVAAEIWRGARSAEPWRVFGLNSASAVRRRLGWLSDRLVEQEQPPPFIRAELAAIDWHQGTPTRISEAVVATVDRVTDMSPGWARALARMLVVMHLGARLGHWPPGPSEIKDARVAAHLYSGVEPAPVRSLPETLQAARALHVRGEIQPAIREWLTADRLHRTPMPLLHVAALLCRVGRIREACWSLRAALMEPETQFPSPAVHSKARMLSAQLSLAMMAKAEAVHGSVQAAQRTSADLDTSTLNWSGQPRQPVPATVPVPTEGYPPESNTAPLTPGSALAVLLETASTSPLVSSRHRDYPAPIPSAPMCISDTIDVPEVLREPEPALLPGPVYPDPSIRPHPPASGPTTDPEVPPAWAAAYFENVSLGVANASAFAPGPRRVQLSDLSTWSAPVPPSLPPVDGGPVDARAPRLADDRPEGWSDDPVADLFFEEQTEGLVSANAPRLTIERHPVPVVVTVEAPLTETIREVPDPSLSNTERSTDLASDLDDRIGDHAPPLSAYEDGMDTDGDRPPVIRLSSEV